MYNIYRRHGGSPGGHSPSKQAEEPAVSTTRLIRPSTRPKTGAPQGAPPKRRQNSMT